MDDANSTRIILDTFLRLKVSAGTFFTTLLTDSTLSDHPCRLSILDHCEEISVLINTHRLLPHHIMSTRALVQEIQLVKTVFKSELQYLIKTQPAWQFKAVHADIKQLEEFKIEEMADVIETDAPHIWTLLYGILTSSFNTAGVSMDITLHGSDREDYEWDHISAGDIGEISEVLTGTTETDKERAIKRRIAIIRVKIVVIVSIFMQATNQRVNVLAGIIGIFLHASKTPERVVEALAHMGISISMNSIHNAISSLSTQSAQVFRQLGESLGVAYAYDNFDVDLQSKVPTVEQGESPSLKHLTSALVFPLQHGVVKSDLECSEYLWKRSALNQRANPEDIPLAKTWRDLLTLHRNPSAAPVPGGSQLTRQDEFNCWQFISDLIKHGPPYFQKFSSDLLPPPPIDPIPVVKTPTYPARAMEFSNSTVSGNISTVIDLARQGGIGDPKDPETVEEVTDISKYVIMFHGDLGTGDRLMSAIIRRSIEDTPWRRLQFVIFVPGFFHFKMAAVDSIWRIFIKPSKARQDATSLFRDVATLRPRETNKVATNPGYRRMMEVVQHAGICRRLHCWLTDAQLRIDSQIKSLSDFANTQPTFSQLEEIARRLVHTYVAKPSVLSKLREQPETGRDKQFENALIFNKVSLLFEELSYAMNHGDIGRIELSIVQWIFLFRGTQKHKYASHLTRFFTDVHFLYPEKLKQAVRYHTLINPTGKAGAFRGVDWCVELNNLATKTEHGGSSSNKTTDRIIKESVLVQAYKNAKMNVDRNFVLTHLTSAHSPPDMRKTFEELGKRLSDNQVHTIIAGRQTEYEIPDVLTEGRKILGNSATSGSTTGKEGGEGGDDVGIENNEVIGVDYPELDDVLIELGAM